MDGVRGPRGSGRLDVGARGRLRPLTRLAAVFTLALGAAACGATPSSPTAQPSVHAASDRARPKLVVLLVVDQLPSWTFSRQRPAFHGGFARLIEEGAYWPRARFPYAGTVTAAGHATLATGAEPRRHGIIGNHWWDRTLSRRVETTEDEAHPSVPPHPRDDGASPRYRMLEAVGAGRRVLSVSYKERAAVLMAPANAAAATWYEPEHAQFVTSTTYSAARPAWLDALASEHPLGPRLGLTWTPLDATPSRALVVDDAPGETRKYGLTATFPHALASADKPALAVGATPLGNEIVLEAAFAGLDAIEPELLDISFSTHDLAAHLWGQESWEATDILLRLDDTIGRLLAGLDSRYGADGWSLVFSSDHGGPPMPERTPGAARIDVADVAKVVKAAAGDASAIAFVDERMVYLSPAAREMDAAARGPILDRIVAALKGTAGIGFAVRTDALETDADCKDLPELETLVCRSLYPGRSGDVYYGPAEGSLVQKQPFDANYHGTPYAYDREVPLVVREPKRRPRIADDEHPSILRVAPTLARLLATPPPPGAREPSL